MLAPVPIRDIALDVDDEEDDDATGAGSSAGVAFWDSNLVSVSPNFSIATVDCERGKRWVGDWGRSRVVNYNLQHTPARGEGGGGGWGAWT